MLASLDENDVACQASPPSGGIRATSAAAVPSSEPSCWPPLALAGTVHTTPPCCNYSLRGLSVVTANNVLNIPTIRTVSARPLIDQKHLLPRMMAAAAVNKIAVHAPTRATGPVVRPFYSFASSYLQSMFVPEFSRDWSLSGPY